jgi:cyanophycin synthetase
MPSLPPFDPAHPALHFRRIMFLRGPNMWSRNPVMEVWVDLANLKDWSSELIPGFNERYKAWLPTVIEHRCSVGERGGFFQRLDSGTYLAHILEHTTLELETLAGCNLGFGRAREMSEEGVYKVAIRYEEEMVAERCLYAARELLLACVYDQPFDVAAKVFELHDLADRRCLGPSSKAILNAAQQRNIPYRRLNQGSLVQLGQGIKQRRIWTAVTDRTPSIAEAIASDKQMTRQLLSAVHVPVPKGRLVSDEEDAWKAAKEIKGAVVVKPRDANHGRGVFPNLTKQSEVVAAFHEASKEGSGVIVERFIPGIEHRVLVVGQRVVAATCGRPVCVTGNGQHTIEQLIQLQVNSDPRRGEDESQPLSPVEIDAALKLILKQQKQELDSVPASGVEVIIKRYDNLSEDVTDKVHPDVAHRAVLAARTVGLDIAGIDMVLEDISQPLEAQQGAVVEVNAGPGLLMHLIPSVGQPRPVGQIIIDHILGPSDDARIPIVCVTGTNGKTTVTRMMQTIMSIAGHTVGLADSDGMGVGDWKVNEDPSDTAVGARDILSNPDVTAGVFEAGADGILREGLGFDKCDIAIVTNLAEPDHLGGEFDLWNDEKLFAVKRTPVDVVLERGAAVLNAADPAVMQMKPLSRGDVILFAQDPNLETIQEHLGAGKRVVIVEQGWIKLCQQNERRSLIELAKIDVVFGGKVSFQVDHVLAVVAAAWHLGISESVIVDGLKVLGRSQALNKRLSIVHEGTKHFIQCMPINLAALKGIDEALKQFIEDSTAQRLIVFGCPCDRRHEDLAAIGRHLAENFDEVVLYPLAECEQSNAAVEQLASFTRESAASANRSTNVQSHRSHQSASKSARASDIDWVIGNIL